MALPARIPKPKRRDTRWRSPKHRDFVRSHGCCVPGCTQRPIEVAHVRMGSGAGLGQKPDDWRTVSLCAEHHRRQHNIGEETFWRGLDVEGLITAFIAESPRRREIHQAQQERANA